jgi:hypothetical protein
MRANGFGGHPDEAAHLVTSLMARDFVAGLDFRHPWQFAQQYYFHYPKVMIGIWQPTFYSALGIWFLIVGASQWKLSGHQQRGTGVRSLLSR